MLFVSIYVYWCPTRFPYNIILMSFTSEAGTAYHTGSPELIPVFSGIHVAQSLDFCVGFFCDNCWSFCAFSVVLHVLLQFTASDFPCGIFKLFLSLRLNILQRMYDTMST